MYRFSTYSPYDPYTAYEEYTTTTIPTYTLQYNLLSLADQQSRLYAQRQQLAAQERELQRQRAAVLRRIRAQRFREAIEEAEVEEIVEAILEKDRDGDRMMKDAVMYSIPRNRADYRGILEEAKARKIQQGLPAEREIYRLLRVREMLDPSPRGPTFVHRPRPRRPSPAQKPRIPDPNTIREDVNVEETPVVSELPRTSTRPFSAEDQYVRETPPAAHKRGSRRTSFRRESQTPHETPTQIASEPLQLYTILRAKLQAELMTIPLSIRSDVSPTVEEKKVLHVHMAKLEDLLDEVDAVPFPTEPEEMTATRKARRDIVAEIVAAIDGIEKYIQPQTPEQSSVEEMPDGEVTVTDDEDSEENALIDFEIQRVIRETLARKKDEATSRLSVSVEDVPDDEY